MRGEQLTNPPRTVDVVVVSWNTRDATVACLGAVAASTGVHPEVVVVDNASTDGTAAAARQAFPGMTVIENADNAGFARAVNQGVRRGAGEYVLLLNPDTEVPAGALAALASRLDELPRHGLLAPRLVGDDGSPQHSANSFPSLRLSVLLALGAQRLLPRRIRARLLLEGHWRSDEDRDVPWVIGAAMLLRRRALEAVGPLDERFFVYAEDMELCDRLWRAGWRVRFTPAVTIRHSGNRSGVQRYGDDRTAVHLASALAWLRRRHGRLWVAAWRAINASATLPRWGAAAVMVRLRPDAARAERVALWRSHARYFVGRARDPDRSLRR